MNTKLEEFKKNINGKNIAVIGIAISNIPAIKYLVGIGAKVTALDMNSRGKLGGICTELEDMNVKLVLGEDYLKTLKGYDYIFRSPGVKPFLKEIEDAVKSGSILTSEIEMLIELSPCKVIGVTGSDGKTTTTTLIYNILKQAGKTVYVGGNIGTPLFSRLDYIKENDILVLELSSFQLMTLKHSPDVAIITNISPNHLDYHKDYDEYVMAKSNIFMHQKDDGVIIFNQDDKMTDRYEDIIQNKNREIRKFSIKDKVENGAYCIEDSIYINAGGETIFVDSVKNIKVPGIHNIANICTAITAIYDIVSVDDIKNVIHVFNGVEHRIELIRELNGVKYYNSSIDSSQYRTMATLKVFDKKVILVAGGKDKGVPYDELGQVLIDKVKTLILIGATAPKIKESLKNAMIKDNVSEDSIEVIDCNTYEEIVDMAYKKAEKDDIVILSPASTSFDMFKNFEERGNTFKKLVNNLK